MKSRALRTEVCCWWSQK